MNGNAIYLDPQAVIKIVFDYYKLPIDIASDKSRKGELVRARQVSMYYLRQYTHCSLNYIGQLFHKDHATVIHANKSVSNQAWAYPAFRFELKKIECQFENIIKDDFKRYEKYETELT